MVQAAGRLMRAGHVGDERGDARAEFVSGDHQSHDEGSSPCLLEGGRHVGEHRQGVEGVVDRVLEVFQDDHGEAHEVDW